MRKENQLLKNSDKNNLSSPNVSVGDLPHLMPLLLLNRKQQPYSIREAEDPGLQIAGMTSLFNNNKAFTLIELLVVVLIIGILAAVALPQYQKAVWKSRYVQAKTMGESLAQAEEIYYLANGEYTQDVSALSIDVPATSCNSNNGICSFSWGRCALLNSSPSVRCYVYKNGAYFLEYDRWLEHSLYPNLKICAAFSTNASDTSNQVCKAETGRSSPTSPQDTRWLWNYF